MPSVHGQSERKFIVLNEYNQLLGSTNTVLAELDSFLGTLARYSTFCPINTYNWRKVLKKLKMICGFIPRYKVLNISIFS